MKCPECEKAGLRSTLSVGATFVTAMAGHSYYDEDGRWHHHDPNRRSTSYHCSNGHEFGITRVYGCKHCGKPDEERINHVIGKVTFP